MLLLFLLQFLLQSAALATAAVIKHKPDPSDVFSCTTPLPYFVNGTKATSWAQYLDEIEAVPAPNGQGAVDDFGGPAGVAPIKWPRNSENKAVISYCYFDKKVRHELRQVIDFAVAEWMTYIGPAGEEAGHAISFEERLDTGGQPVYCFKGSDTDSNHWNPVLPYETVAIMMETSQGGWEATVGLNPERTKPWRNRISGPKDGNLYVWAAMHELGHVMGMEHEHQRPDRDDYIVVLPENINDFEECYQRAHRNNPRITRENVCNHIRYALRYDCKCKDFIKGMSYLNVPLFSFDYYDIYSIMHYSSAAGGTEKCQVYSDDKDVAQCAIQVYSQYVEHAMGLTKLAPNLHPSAQDIMWVRHVYRWDEG